MDARESGAKGGRVSSARLTPSERVARARAAAIARWQSMPVPAAVSAAEAIAVLRTACSARPGCN